MLRYTQAPPQMFMAWPVIKEHRYPNKFLKHSHDYIFSFTSVPSFKAVAMCSDRIMH
jgi:hypothetical protein